MSASARTVDRHPGGPFEEGRRVETKQELEAALGAPDETDKFGPIEKWTYSASDGEMEFVITGDKIAPTGPPAGSMSLEPAWGPLSGRSSAAPTESPRTAPLLVAGAGPTQRRWSRAGDPRMDYHVEPFRRKEAISCAPGLRALVQSLTTSYLVSQDKEKLALRIDGLSRVVFPVCFTVLVLAVFFR